MPKSGSPRRATTATGSSTEKTIAEQRKSLSAAANALSKSPSPKAQMNSDSQDSSPMLRRMMSRISSPGVLQKTANADDVFTMFREDSKRSDSKNSNVPDFLAEQNKDKTQFSKMAKDYSEMQNAVKSMRLMLMGTLELYCRVVV